MARFIVSVIFASAALAIMAVKLGDLKWISARPSYMIEILLVLSLSTVFIYNKLRKIPSSRPERFVRLYLATIVLKLFLGGAFVLVMVLKDQIAAMANGGFFVASYMVFTGIEVAFLMKRTS